MKETPAENILRNNLKQPLVNLGLNFSEYKRVKNLSRMNAFWLQTSHVSRPMSELFQQLRVSLKNGPTSDTGGDFYKQPARGCAQEEAGSNKDKWTRMQRWASACRGGMDISIHQRAPFPDRRSCRRARGLDNLPPFIWVPGRADGCRPAFDESVCVKGCQLGPFRWGPETNMSTYQTSLPEFSTEGKWEKGCGA